MRQNNINMELTRGALQKNLRNKERTCEYKYVVSEVYDHSPQEKMNEGRTPALPMGHVQMMRKLL